jgi:hypothetical protein
MYVWPLIDWLIPTVIFGFLLLGEDTDHYYRFFFFTGDEIKTVDEIILEHVESGYDVYEIKYKPPRKLQTTFDSLFQDEEEELSSGGGVGGGWIDSAVRWLVRRITTSVKRELLMDGSSTTSVEQRYLAKDDTADRINSM